MAPLEAAGANAPQRASGLKAAFDYLNEHGGLGPEHHKVEVKTCNTQLTPPGEIQCGQEAASDPTAIAVVSPIVVISTEPFMSSLEDAGMPVVNPAVSDTAQATSPVAFPLGADILAPTACAVLGAEATDADTMGLAGSATAVTEAQIQTASDALEKAGVEPVGPVTFPITTTDVTPFVTQLAEDDPDATTLIGSPQNVGQWLAAEQRLGKTRPTCTNDALTPPQVLIGLGGALTDFYTAASLPDPSWDGYPMLDDFKAQATAAADAGDETASLEPTNSPIEVLSGWMGAQALIQGAANVTGEVTKTSLLEALNTTTVTFGDDKPLIPPVDFSKPGPDAAYPRVFNTTMFLKKWDPSKQQFELVDSVDATDISTLID